jgi:hypothetical protein
MNQYEEELSKERDRMTLENEFRNTQKEDLFTSPMYSNILKYSKNVFDFKNPKLTMNIDVT